MRTAVFDLDGTLADTGADLIAAANATLVPEGFAPLDPVGDKVVAFGGGRAMLRTRIADEDRVDRLYPALLGHYEAGIARQTRLYAGVADSLELLLARDWRLGVCTNKPAYLAEILLAELGIRGMFAAVLGADSLPVRKPDPRHLLETIRLCGGTSARSVLVGDSVTDLDTANNALVPCVLVAFGPEGMGVAGLRPAALLDEYASLAGLLERIHPARMPA